MFPACGCLPCGCLQSVPRERLLAQRGQRRTAGLIPELAEILSTPNATLCRRDLNMARSLSGTQRGTGEAPGGMRRIGQDC
jgi:hypothetical protein